MVRYARLNAGTIVHAPNPVLHGGLWYGNPPGEVYLAEGYKPVTCTDQPPPQGVGRYEEIWTETADAIVQGWVWHEAGPEDEISPEEALDVLTGGDGP